MPLIIAERNAYTGQEQIWIKYIVHLALVKHQVMQEITFQIKYSEYESIAHLPEKDNVLLMKARETAKNAYAPYSGFRVGAAVQLGNGVIVTGNNQENAAYPSGICAERTALFYASAQYPHIPIIALAISTLNGTATPSGVAKPCGACRQVMAEYEDLAGKPLRIILDSFDKVLVLNGIDSLLPLRFKKEDVK